MVITSRTAAIRSFPARAGIGAVIVLCAVCIRAQTISADPPPAANPGDPPPAAKATKPAPATPLDTKKIEFGWNKIWQPQWDMVVENALPASLLSNQVPRDVRRFCPRFYTMSDANKRAFWAYFFQALAAAEAGLNPTSHVHHTDPTVDVPDEVTHFKVRSEGLLQLTYEDEKRYGCNFDWEIDRHLAPGDPDRTILQPENNLGCGVKILTRQIIDKHEPLVCRNSYWGTLRPGTLSFHVFAKQMTNPPLACGLHRTPAPNLAAR